MNQAIIYVHGKGGNASEADYYRSICKDYDVYGFEYEESLPWIVAPMLRDMYERIQIQYDEVSIITNSIGTFYAMLALSDTKIKKAYFISPIVNMERLITDMMSWAQVTLDELEEKKTIHTSFGEDLSYEYLTFVRENPIKWTINTAILYAGKDNLTSRETIEEFSLKHNARLTIMEDGEHWFHTKEQLSFLEAWLREELE